MIDGSALIRGASGDRERGEKLVANLRNRACADVARRRRLRRHLGPEHDRNALDRPPVELDDATLADAPEDLTADEEVRPQVVADAQSILQEQGYYRGEVDGLVGPLTQEALVAYQRDQGLEQTAAIDEPTLNALGLT